MQALRERDTEQPDILIKILIVDDEPMICELVSRALRKTGFESIPVVSGEEALQAVESDSYGLCFLDHVLPGMSGIDTMRHIKTRSPQTQVVMMSAEEIIGHSLANGADYFLSKPFGFAEITSILRHAAKESPAVANGLSSLEQSEAIMTCRPLKKVKPGGKTSRLFVDYAGKVIETEDFTWVALKRGTVDIGSRGLHILGVHPLEPGDVLRLKRGAEEITGSIQWSTMLDESTCRVGIKFL
jgi:CheY-like chemotaxis protein